MRLEQILLVLRRDDRGLAHLLRQNALRVDTSIDFAQANQMLRFRNYGAILLDGDSNTEEALLFCREYSKGSGEAFLVVISDSTDPDFLVSLFDGGADTTLCNSYHDREIVLRICSLFRRRNGQMIPQNMESVRIEDQNRVVSKGGKTVRLSVSESQIIEFLLASPKRTCSTVELLDKLGDSKVLPTESAVRRRIKFMKEKLTSIGAGDFISTSCSAGTTLACLGA